MPEESKNSRTSLVDELRGKGDIELSIEISRGGIVGYCLVAHYSDGKEGIAREEFFTKIHMASRLDPPPKKVGSKKVYHSILSTLMPNVDPQSFADATLEDMVVMLVNLNARVDALTNAGIKVVKIGGYDGVKKFKADYSKAKGSC